MNTISRTDFDRDGYVLAAAQLIDDDLLARAVEHMDLVIAGEHETGVAPPSGWKPGNSATSLVKIDNAHMCDRTLTELISHPALGRLGAELYGADMVQVWATQLLHKPGTGAPPAEGIEGKFGNVGWHQDMNYWHSWWSGEVFTVWLALADVDEDMGPMRFVRGSHRWGYQEAGNFFQVDLDATREAIGADEWDEVPAILSAGCASVHHPLTIHGSGPNVSTRPRRAIAVHMRTEKAEPLSPLPYLQWLDDPAISPVVFSR